MLGQAQQNTPSAPALGREADGSLCVLRLSGLQSRVESQPELHRETLS